VQRRLAWKLHRISDTAVTSVDLYRRLLDPASQKNVVVIPVFSTVGEPEAPAPLEDRRRRMVVFGSAGLRRRAYGEARRALARSCATLGVEEIVDVGRETAAPSAIDGVSVTRLGELTPTEVSDLLSDCIAGFLCYPPSLVGKSTVFAAFSAHRLVPVCAPPEVHALADDGPVPHLWEPDRDPPESWQTLADAALDWYRGHSLGRHVSLFSTMLQ
jgi:hypothetical protein